MRSGSLRCAGPPPPRARVRGGWGRGAFACSCGAAAPTASALLRCAPPPPQLREDARSIAKEVIEIAYRARTIDLRVVALSSVHERASGLARALLGIKIGVTKHAAVIEGMDTGADPAVKGPLSKARQFLRDALKESKDAEIQTDAEEELREVETDLRVVELACMRKEGVDIVDESVEDGVDMTLVWMGVDLLRAGVTAAAGTDEQQGDTEQEAMTTKELARVYHKVLHMTVRACARAACVERNIFGWFVCVCVCGHVHAPRGFAGNRAGPVQPRD
jgi:hypothetical protein